jgi:two-component system, chemotaxis family, sensor kinase CheA
MDEVIKYFLIESHEETDRLDSNLLALESDPSNKEIINILFRGFHSIKGTCGFLGFPILEKLTHSAENILGYLREGKLTSNSQVIGLLLESNTITKQILKNIESSEGKSEGEEEYVDFLLKLQNALVAPVSESPKVQESVQVQANINLDEVSEKESEPLKSDILESTIRVDVKLLDKLINLIGELVLGRNQLVAITERMRDSQLLLVSQKLNSLTGELQEGIMKTRMQPIKTAWDKFPRLVRDISMQLGKKIQIELQGEDTELDKSIIEAIKDPLTHLVRNSLDHGIESPEERTQKGKPSQGKIVLSAHTEGGQVHISIRDDGKGLDPEKLKTKAIAKGLLTREKAESISETEALHLILLPGFSTAEQITNLSGRGVGMDVVKANLEKIGGSLHIHNEKGKGLSFKISIPLTLTILPSLLVKCGQYKFAIPQLSLREVVELDSENSTAGFETIHGSLLYNLRGKLLTVTKLHELLGVEPLPKYMLSSEVDTTIVVVGNEFQRFGLIVDEVVDTEEIVVKPLGKHIQNIFCYSGLTILGDGDIAFILNIQGIADKLKTPILSDTEFQEKYNEELSSFVVFELQGKYKLAIPLENVARIEEMDSHSLKESAGKKVISYRDRLIPVVNLQNLLINGSIETSLHSNDQLKILIYQDAEISIGLMIDRIIDIYEGVFTIQKKDGNWKDLPIEADSVGSISIGNDLIDVLDIQSVSKKFKSLLLEEMLSKG